MHVAAAGIDQLRDHLPLNGDDISDEFFDVPVNRLGALPSEALGNPIRADQADLDGILREAGGETILLEDDIALEAQPLERWASCRDGRALRIEVLLGAVQRAVWLAPVLQAFDMVRHVKAADRRAEAFLEISPPEFTVGHNRPADRFLLAHDIDNCLVFNGAELGIVHLRARVPLERVAQRLRRHETAVLVGAKPHQIDRIIEHWRGPGFRSGAARAAQYCKGRHG